LQIKKKVMGKVVKLTDVTKNVEIIYLEFMTGFWEQHDLYWELSEGGFYIWSEYIEVVNTVIKNEAKILAAAANLLIIEYTKDRILEEGYQEFEDHLKLLSSYYQINPHEISKMSDDLRNSLQKTSFDLEELAWNDEADEHKLETEGAIDNFKLTSDVLGQASEIVNKKNNFHVKIYFDKSFPFSNEQLTQLINEEHSRIMTNNTINLYQIYSYENEISFSIDCHLGFLIHFSEILKEQYQMDLGFEVINNCDENAFTPDLHYSSFMAIYRDINESNLKNGDGNELMDYFEKYNTLSPEERRKQNPNAREDDEYASLLLYSLPREEGINNAKMILHTNSHNIEAQILIAGWEGDLEKRIDLLSDASDINNLDYEYKQIQKDKIWWGASHTRPFMRAKYLLAKVYELGGYIDDAIDRYKEIIEMNPSDNQGVRIDLIRLLYKTGDKKELTYLINKFPNETDEYFSFGGVYITFMKYGKSAKTDKKILFSLKTNYYLACMIAKMEPALLTDFLDLSDDEDELVYEHCDKYNKDILPLFKNAELLKYYRKVLKELSIRLTS